MIAEKIFATEQGGNLEYDRFIREMYCPSHKARGQKTATKSTAAFAWHSIFPIDYPENRTNI